MEKQITEKQYASWLDTFQYRVIPLTHTVMEKSLAVTIKQVKQSALLRHRNCTFIKAIIKKKLFYLI